MSNRIIYLAKDNDDLCCHCLCEEARISFPPQMDCPWCGCGWLFSCTACRKAFTFARAVEVDTKWDELALSDIKGRWSNTPSKDDIEAWIGAMQALLAHIELGKQYVCLDGLFIPTDATEVSFEGWHSRHDLEFVPQVAALDDYFVMENVLCSVEYWQSNELPRDG